MMFHKPSNFPAAVSAETDDNVRMLFANINRLFVMLILFASASLAYAANPTATAVKGASDQEPPKEVCRSSWAKVTVDRKLYLDRKTGTLYAHVYIANICDHPIGFDFTNRMNVFYPNQWCESNTPNRQLIDEIRRNQNPPDEKTKQSLLTRMHDPSSNDTFVILDPGKQYTYFIDLNSGKPELLQKSKYAYLILVMDGNMALTDGKTIQMLNRDPHDMVKTEVPIKAPILFPPMRYAAHIIK